MKQQKSVRLYVLFAFNVYVTFISTCWRTVMFYIVSLCIMVDFTCATCNAVPIYVKCIYNVLPVLMTYMYSLVIPMLNCFMCLESRYEFSGKMQIKVSQAYDRWLTKILSSLTIIRANIFFLKKSKLPKKLYFK